MKVPIRSQVDAVELVLANRKGFVDTLRGLVEAKKRQQVELEIAEQPLPALEAAAKTLKWVMDNENEIKEALKRQRET